MRADNRHHIVQAARRRSEHTRAKAIQTLRVLDNSGQPVTFEAVAAQALLTELCLEFQQFSG